MILELQKNLEAKGYIVDVFDTKEEAASYINSALDQKYIGIGGSQTVAQMNLYPMLSSHNKVIWHDELPEGMSVMEARQGATRADVYISSVNGISKDGIIINIDGTGNRVAALSFGPKQIYLIIGENKIAEDYDSALYRARNIASPLNAQRLHRNTPCAVNADRCYDCKSPERICRNLSVFWEKPYGSEYHVILIKESLGY